jgi:hypothetical protein
LQEAKIIGNSVDRRVSLASGLALREAWEKNPPDDKIHDSVVIAEDTSTRSTKSQPVLFRERHGRFSKNSSNSSSFSIPSASANSSPDNETNEVAARSKDVLPSVKPPPVVRDSNGLFAKKKPNKASQDKAKRLHQNRKRSTSLQIELLETPTILRMTKTFPSRIIVIQ